MSDVPAPPTPPTPAPTSRRDWGLRGSRRVGAGRVRGVRCPRHHRLGRRVRLLRPCYGVVIPADAQSPRPRALGGVGLVPVPEDSGRYGCGEGSGVGTVASRSRVYPGPDNTDLGRPSTPDAGTSRVGDGDRDRWTVRREPDHRTLVGRSGRSSSCLTGPRRWKDGSPAPRQPQTSDDGGPKPRGTRESQRGTTRVMYPVGNEMDRPSDDRGSNTTLPLRGPGRSDTGRGRVHVVDSGKDLYFSGTDTPRSQRPLVSDVLRSLSPPSSWLAGRVTRRRGPHLPGDRSRTRSSFPVHGTLRCPREVLRDPRWSHWTRGGPGGDPRLPMSE